MNTTNFIHGIIAILIAATLISCTEASKKIILFDGSTVPLPKRTTFTANVGSAINSFNWTQSYDSNSSIIYENIMAGLTKFDFSGPAIKVAPSLAKKWQSSDKIIWRFYLKKKIYWSDGVELIADHFIDAWEKSLTKESNSIGLTNLHPIKKAREFSRGLVDFKQVGIKKVSSHLVEIVLNGPLDYFPMLLAHHVTFPIRKDLMMKYKKKWHHPENIATLGPFKPIFIKWGQRAVLKRNNLYYGPSPSIEYLDLLNIENEATASRLLMRGELDFNRLVPENLNSREKKSIVKSLGLRTTYLVFNTTKPPLDSQMCRKWIASAINKSKLVTILDKRSLSLDTWVPSSLYSFPYQPPHRSAVLEAQDSCKFSTARNTLNLAINSTERIKLIATSLQYQISKLANVDIKIKSSPWAEFLAKIKNKDFDIALMGWSADYPHPDNFMSIFLSSNNHSGWSSPYFSSLIEEARKAKTTVGAMDLYRKAEDIINSSAPAVPLLTNSVRIQVSSRVRGIKVNPLKKYDFSSIFFKK